MMRLLPSLQALLRSELKRDCGFVVLCSCLLLALATSARSQTNEWTWMGGNSTLPSGLNGGYPGIGGAQGESSTGYIPGSRWNAMTWVDPSGDLWLFGGDGYDRAGAYGVLNDLWKFNPADNTWAWMGGGTAAGSSTDQAGVYPSQWGGVGSPGSRANAAAWVDGSGNLWLFGGNGFDASGGCCASLLSDLWMFNPATNQWTWMDGSNIANVGGAYGTLGSASNANFSGSRQAAMSWVSGGNFWLFGGQAQDANNVDGVLNDLWMISPGSPSQYGVDWAWMSGSNVVSTNDGADDGWPGVYGNLGSATPGSVPGSRMVASSWVDISGNLWLFGGQGLDAGSNLANLNDVWKYIPSASQWVWMGGSATAGTTNNGFNPGQPGVYGTEGVAAAGNIPGGRSESASWTDKQGNFWIFGGFGYDVADNYAYLNDLWEFNPSTNEWTWMGGNSSIASGILGGQAGIYGTLGTSAAGNIPGSRYASVGWTDKNGNLWMFGGYGFDSLGHMNLLNDLWKFQPGPFTPPVAATPSFSPVAGTYTSAQTVSISDNTAGATIYYTTDGSTPTTSSTVYAGAITVPSSETLQAIAVASGYSNSAVASASYIINLPAVATPVFSVVSGTYTSAQTVSISDATSGAVIYYTSNGTTPTTSSTVYTGPITVSSSETLQAIAVASGYSNSAVASASYIINLPHAAAPTFTLPAGTYTSTEQVGISDATSGAQVYYTTNGTTPTAGSTLYTGPITVSSSEILQAIAVAPGYSSSAVASATYTLVMTASAPVISPSGGTYTSVQTVTLADYTTGAAIYYTTNGSTPTTGSTLYTGPIAVSATETIKAIAAATGYNNSTVVSATYTINLPAAATPVFSVPAGTYAAAQTVALSDTTPNTTIYYTTNGTTPTTGSTVYAGPITVSASETLQAIAVATGYKNSAVASAAYIINPGAFACHVVYTMTPQNSSAFGATISITNTGTAPISSWTLTFAFANGQKITQLWNGNETQNGVNVTVTNMSYNGSIAAGASVTGVGFNGTWNGATNAAPTAFAVNGTACK
jgi:N-acetylneuraminic acid mutarotase